MFLPSVLARIPLWESGPQSMYVCMFLRLDQWLFSSLYGLYFNSFVAEDCLTAASFALCYETPYNFTK